MTQYRYIWSSNKTLEKLNKLGYVHFYTKDHVDEMKEGRAFYFCVENKKYGFVDVIPYDEVKNIKSNLDYIESCLKANKC